MYEYTHNFVTPALVEINFIRKQNQVEIKVFKDWFNGKYEVIVKNTEVSWLPNVEPYKFDLDEDEDQFEDEIVEFLDNEETMVNFKHEEL